ncbi:MAG: leucyl aminopeptidase [Candidatus Babeliales bacterium]|jgi:leucyl aminopeptidase
MLSLQLTKKKFWDHAVEGYIFFLKENLDPASSLATFDVIEKEYYPQLRNILKKHQFEGKRGQSLVLSGTRNKNMVQFIFIGVGKLENTWHVELEHLRRAMGLVIHILKKFSITSALYALPDEKPFGVSNTELLYQLAITAHMASYEFTTFKSEKKKNSFKCTLTVTINPNFDERSFAIQISQADILGAAINNARTWADTPANFMTPTALAQEAQKVADKHKNISCTIFGRDKALELGMGGFCAVDAGSEQDGKFIILEYGAAIKKAPTVVLVGKGVAFDTGGINLKPTNSIEHMKYDMTGAASVIALMSVFAQLKPDVNIISIAPCVENMPSGKAARPDDIITCMNGKTVEIKNTDAEGRLILADALCYAEKFYKPDYIIDIATLTGAVLYALGHLYTGLMTKDRELATKLIELGTATGDRVWELPLDDDFKEAIKCEVADIHNNGSPAYYAGTIVGACFLSNFVSKARWAHLDVAGTAHDVTGVNYVGKGATGASMRLLTAFVMGLNNR